ncbi:SMI1/KNR4 family protein [Nocardia salmonicida]|uniref:SMI1/KNR4 family protein n=1 Tax=Nocardia salmonicida TaxID=53431 RepID=UPI000A48BF5D|nr:SMI1/KNR4 family protein [Nocardia salmonicida]
MDVTPIEESLRRIDSWLAAHAPRTYASLQPPAAPEAISAAAAELGVEFPADLVAYLRHHDGVSPGEGSFSFPGHQPYTLAEILASSRIHHELWGSHGEDLPFEGYWHQDFVTFARTSSADALVVDCRRGESFGAVGQHVESEGTRFGNWESLAAFSEQIADSLEGGTAMTVGLPYAPVVDDGILLWEFTPEPRSEPQSLLDLASAAADPLVAAPRRPISRAAPTKNWPSGYNSFCLTFAQGLDEAELLRRFGALPETRRPRGRRKTRGGNSVLLPAVRVGTHDGWAFGIQEEAGVYGFEGTREEVLRRVSCGTRAVSVSCWGGIGSIAVSLFDNSEPVTRYDTRSAVVPDGMRDPFEVFPGLPLHDKWAARWDPDQQCVVSVVPPLGRETAPEQWREQLLAVCGAIVRSCGIPLPPPGLNGELDSAQILPLLPADGNQRVPVPDRFAALVDAATPEHLRRVLATQMTSLAAETGLDTYDEVADALPLLREGNRPGLTDDSALGLRLRRIHVESRATRHVNSDQVVWQDRAMAARALADALTLPVREALGLVVVLRQDPQWRREFRKQLADD